MLGVKKRFAYINFFKEFLIFLQYTISSLREAGSPPSGSETLFLFFSLKGTGPPIFGGSVSFVCQRAFPGKLGSGKSRGEQ